MYYDIIIQTFIPLQFSNENLLYNIFNYNEILTQMIERKLEPFVNFIKWYWNCHCVWKTGMFGGSDIYMSSFLLKAYCLKILWSILLSIMAEVIFFS